MEEGQRERGRERIPSRFCIVSTEPDAGLDPTNQEGGASTNLSSRFEIMT